MEYLELWIDILTTISRADNALFSTKGTHPKIVVNILVDSENIHNNFYSTVRISASGVVPVVSNSMLKSHYHKPRIFLIQGQSPNHCMIHGVQIFYALQILPCLF